MNLKKTPLLCVAKLFVVVLVAQCLVGCKEAEHGDHIVYHHKPEGFKGAVNRLLVIHQSMVADAPLPEPRHFDNHDDHHHDHDHDDGHSDDHDDVVEVEIFQELEDIVRWLPTIAADSDLPKEPWDRINGQIKTLAELTRLSGKDDEQKRSSYVENAEKIQSVLNELKNEFEEYDMWDKKYPG